MRVCDRCLSPDCFKFSLTIDKIMSERYRGRPTRVARGEHWLCERCRRELIKRFKEMLIHFIGDGMDPELNAGEDPTPEKSKKLGRPKGSVKRTTNDR